MRALAINVGANTNEPGFRGPVHPDGRFEFLPIPESKPTDRPVPTYGDLAPHVETPIPESLAGRRVHLDPEFLDYPFGEAYTYGDEHGVKAGPLSELSAGDYVFFYATLSVTDPADWLPPAWGAFVVAHFRLARDPVTADYADLPASLAHRLVNNAHVKRERVDARVFLVGDPDESRRYERCVPLSATAGGTEPGDLVREYSGDSGRGPWWRRPLPFDEDGTAELLARHRERRP